MKNSYSKNIIKILIITMLSTGMAFADEYCNGYTEGYKSGYREAVGVPGMDVSVPICSPQPIGFNDETERKQQEGYRQGYQEGYKEGQEQQ